MIAIHPPAGSLTRRVLLLGLLTALCLAPTPNLTAAAAGSLDVLEMKSVPDGHYLVNFQQGGVERLVNLKIESNAAQGVNASDPQLKNLKGTFELIGNGVFLIVLRNESHTASQWWLFRPDGTAVVKEVPDRGENQRAIPVRDSSLERKTPPR